jgi:hypothetical protein
MRPDDRLVQIDAKETSYSVKFQNQELLILKSESQDNPISFEQIKQFRPHWALLNGNIHYEADVQVFLEKLRMALIPSTRVILTFYSTLWKPFCGSLRLSACADTRRKRIGSLTKMCAISDPFGDFDLIFGAARMALRIVEVPVLSRAHLWRDEHSTLAPRNDSSAYARIRRSSN